MNITAAVSSVTNALLVGGPDVLPTNGGMVVVALVGNVLLFVLGARLTILSLRVRRRAARPRAALWEYFTIAGTIGMLYGGLTTVGIVAGQHLIVLDGLLLAFVVALAFTMREAYYNTIASATEAERLGRFYGRRGIELVFVALVLVTALGPLVAEPRPIAITTAVAAILAVGYGLLYQRRRIAGTATRGTLIDSLLRLTVPVLVFASGVLIVGAAQAGSIEQSVLDGLTNAFLLLTASSLLAVTIKLGTHVRGL